MRTLFISIVFICSFNSRAQFILSKVELEKNIYLEASVEKFHVKKHKLDTCATGLGWDMICLIDNKIWFGSDDGLVVPKYQLSKLTIVISGTKVSLDVSGMFNPTFTGKLIAKQFTIEKDQPGNTLSGYFSDGAGTYIAVWKIVKGKSMRIKISRDEADFR